MPYNINPPCSSGAVTEITFRVEGEPSSIIKTNGDDYRIIIENVPRPQYKIKVFWKPIHRRNCDAFPEYSAEMFVPGPLTGEVHYEYIEPPYSNCRVISRARLRTAADGDEHWLWPLIVFSYFGGINEAAPGSVRISVIGATNNSYSGFNKHTAEIYKNGQFIESFSRSASGAAIFATWRCIGGCPPDTCEVLCGDTICCYNSEGISVFNYPNT